MRLLFVTWDGPQVAYLQSLFLPIFQGLAAHGIRVDVLQFRWGSTEEADEIARRCADSGCSYRHLPIRRGLAGLGPFVSALTGAAEVRRAVRDFASDAIMPRSLMPAIAVRAAGGARLKPILFDADGLQADERVDVGSLSARGPTYRILRAVEASTVRASACVLVRSAAAARILRDRAGQGVGPERFHIVSNGRDEAVFHPHDEPTRRSVRESLGIGASAPLAVYAGSVGPQYRFDLIRAFAAELAQVRPDARLLVLSGSPDSAREALGEDAPLRPLVMRAAPDRIAPLLAAADVGLAFRARSFSVQGVSPVKLGEYLLCGVPAIGNVEVGDTAAAVAQDLLFDDRAGPAAAARWLVEKVLPRRDSYRVRAREVGTARFSLRRSIDDYLGAIASLREAAERRA